MRRHRLTRFRKYLCPVGHALEQSSGIRLTAAIKREYCCSRLDDCEFGDDMPCTFPEEHPHRITGTGAHRHQGGGRLTDLVG
jgi:hypothetical protein